MQNFRSNYHSQSIKNIVLSCPSDMKPSPQTRGRLIVFEGIDGTGKSTQIQLLSARLKAEGKQVLCSFEPTQGEWGRRVREAARSGTRLPMEEEIDCLLRDRQQHVEDLINPALNAGSWVLLDRYYPSMMAYQGASGADITQIQQLNEAFAPLPDLAIYIKLSLEESHRRITTRGLAPDAFEEGGFQARVAAIYDSLSMPWWQAIDGSSSPEHIAEIVAQHCTERFCAE